MSNLQNLNVHFKVENSLKPCTFPNEERMIFLFKQHRDNRVNNNAGGL